MSLTIQNYNSISDTNIATPTSDQRYPLGLKLTFLDSANADAVKKFMYVKSHAALTQYQPYVVKFSSTSASQVITAAPSTLAAPGLLLVVPQVAFTSGYYGWVQIEGDATAKIGAETYAAGDYLEVLNTGTVLTVDGTSGSTTLSVNSKAIAKASGSSAANIAVYLLGYRSVVAAS